MIAVCEFTWRRRKLAVDEDVRNRRNNLNICPNKRKPSHHRSWKELFQNESSITYAFIIFTRIKTDFTYPHRQASVTAEMWEEFKFAINPFAGDTKPNPAITAEQNALSRASSKMMSKVLFFSLSFLLVGSHYL